MNNRDYIQNINIFKHTHINSKIAIRHAINFNGKLNNGTNECDIAEKYHNSVIYSDRESGITLIEYYVEFIRGEYIIYNKILKMLIRIIEEQKSIYSIGYRFHVDDNNNMHAHLLFSVPLNIGAGILDDLKLKLKNNEVKQQKEKNTIAQKLNNKMRF